MEDNTIEDFRGGSGGSQFFVGAVSLLALAIFSLVVYRKGKGPSLRLPPGPRGLPVFGSLLALGFYPPRTFAKWARQYGPLMYFRMGSVPVVVVSTSSMAREFLKSMDHKWASRPIHIIIECLSFGEDMAFREYGAHWRNLRKVCSLELFTVARLNQFESARRKAVLVSLGFMHRAWKQGNVLDMHQVTSDISSNIVTLMMWNKMHRVDEGDESVEAKRIKEFPKIVSDTVSLMAAINIGDYIPALRPVSMNLLGLEKRMREIREEMDKFLEEILIEHEKAEKKVATECKDFVDVLLEYKQAKELASGDERISRDTVKGMLWDLVMAGTDTSSTAMEWTLAELLKNPGMMKKAQDELKSNIPASRLVTEADLPNLTYIHAVVKETLRMHPPAPLGIPHKSMEDCEVGGYFIPAGTQLFVNQWAIHRDPEFWEKPGEFNPDRFLSSPLDVNGVDFDLIPFGSGRRMCPATAMSVTVLNYTLAQLLHTFTFTLADANGDQVKFPEKLDMTETFGVTCPKAAPLMVTCKPRLADRIIFPDSDPL